MQTLAQTFKPNKASLGYALFLAINATVAWGGVFPFLPYSIQTSDVMLWFFLAEASAFALAFFASVIGAYFIPGRTKRFLVTAASLPYALGWICLIVASYLHDATAALVIGGALLGIGSAGFYMLWQRLFAATEPERGSHDLIVGTVYASIIYLALHAIPRAVTAILVPLMFLPLFALAIVISSRRVDLNQPMFDDKPREQPQVYRRAIADVWRSALSLGALGLCSGIMRAVAITDPAIGSIVNIISMVASFLAALALLAAWSKRGVTLNVPSAYRAVFPLVIIAFVLMPLVSGPYINVLAGLLYALHSVGILLMMVQCAQISRDRGINPVFIYGFFGGIMYALHDLGFILSAAVNVTRVPGVASPAMIALVSVSALSILLLISSRPESSGIASWQDGNSIELVGAAPAAGTNAAEHDAPPAPRSGVAAVELEHAPTDSRDSTAPYLDRISKQVALMKVDYALSTREAEVAELLARGETVARIAEELFVSENTVRTHSKRIYAKLDIHKKQELRDLVDTYDPSAIA